MELNESCTQLAMELLKSTMLNQSVVLSVKGISKNVHTVSVEKCSENGVVNIAEKLLMCGLAETLPSKRKGATAAGTVPNAVNTCSRGLSCSALLFRASVPSSHCSCSALLQQLSLPRSQCQHCCRSRGPGFWDGYVLSLHLSSVPLILILRRIPCVSEMESSWYPKRCTFGRPPSPKRGPIHHRRPNLQMGVRVCESLRTQQRSGWDLLCMGDLRHGHRWDSLAQVWGCWFPH